MNTDLITRIEAALNEIRPFLAADGGNVALLEVTEEKIVKLELQGACKSCSMRMMTFKAGIEEAIRRAAPEIKGIEALDLVSHITEPS